MMAYCQSALTVTKKIEEVARSESGKTTCHSVKPAYNKDATGLELYSETLPGLLRNQVLATPDAFALDSYACKWTYAELERNVSTASDLFKSHGVRSGDKVGLYFHLSPWAVVSILATMRLGAAIVPVDPVHPPARRKTMLREAGADKVIVEDSSFVDDLLDSGFLPIDVSVIASLLHKTTSALVADEPEPDPGSDAFIAFTSGSTGTPKGIVQTHEAIVTMSKALAHRLHVDESSRVAQFHPYIFDVAMMEIGMFLATGATLCISKRKDMMLPSPGEVGQQLAKASITHITLSPTMLNAVNTEDVSTLKVLSVMGEPLGLLALKKWASNDKCIFYQLWGCTEASILQSITTPITSSHAPQNIGMAINGTCRLWIVDPTDIDRLMPTGEAGELIVESRVLAKGYLNQPKENAKVFIRRASWMDISSRGTLYKTGDLARKEADGTLTFLGRLDCQMNYFGERIELGEIDYHISQAQTSQMLECFSEFHAPSKTVVGFVCGARKTAVELEGDSGLLLLSWDTAVVPKSTMQQLTKELVEKGELPEYMVPRFWIPIRQRPLTVSGKTDRSCLRDVMQNLTAAQWEDCHIPCRTSHSDLDTDE